MNGLLSALSESASPRVVVTSSMASLMPNDSVLVDAMLSLDEPSALKRAEELVAQGGGLESLIYGSSKRAIGRWIRQISPTPDFAGAGIAINAIGPGIVETPVTKDMIATDEAKAGLLQVVPMPLNGIMRPEVVAKALIWLGSEDNSHMTGHRWRISRSASRRRYLVETRQFLRSLRFGTTRGK